MNRSYKSVWNDSLGAWVAASELSRGGKKSLSRGLGGAVVALITAGQVAAGGPASDYAHPVAMEVASVPSQADPAVSGAASGRAYAAATGNDAAFPVLPPIPQSHVPEAMVRGRVAAGRADPATHYYSVNDNGVQGGNYANDGATGKNSLAAGVGAAATAEAAIAIGASSATGGSAIAMGQQASAQEVNAIAIGAEANAQGSISIAIGKKASAIGANSVAIGPSSTVTQSLSLAVGGGNTVSVNQSAAVGLQNHVQNTGGDGAAFGSFNTVSGAGRGNLAVGFFNMVSGDYATALGQRNEVAGTQSMALGYKNTVSADNAFVLGSNVTVTSANNVVLGNDSTDRAAVQVSSATVPGVIATLNPDGTVTYAPGPSITYGNFAGTAAGVVSVGARGAERQIVNVAPGEISSTSTDAINGSQLYAVASTVNALGGSLTTIVNNAQTHYYSVNDGGTKQGNYDNSGASAANSIAVGAGASVGSGAVNSLAVGTNASATTANSVAVGANATVSTANSVALGAGSTTAAATPTASTTIQGQTYDFAGAAPVGVVSVGAPGAERQIQNVAAGQISATSTDAINGSQLYATNQAINNIVVGGTGIKYFHANSAAADSQAAGAESVAIGPQAVSQGAGSIAVGNGSLATAANGVALGAGATADRGGMAGGQELFSNTAVASTQGAVSVGSAGNERQITNVAGGTQATDAVNVRQLQAVKNSSVQYQTNVDGSVDYNNVTLGNNTGPTTIHNVAPGVAGNDAVNVNQLNSGIAGANAYTDKRVNGLQNNIDGVARKAYAGVASAMAMESAPFVPGKVTYAAGAGYYQNQGAIGIALRRTADNGRWSVTGGMSASAGSVGARIGIAGVWN